MPIAQHADCPACRLPSMPIARMPIQVAPAGRSTQQPGQGHGQAAKGFLVGELDRQLRLALLVSVNALGEFVRQVD